MTLHVRRFGNLSAPPIVFVAGFGDDGGMFESLGDTVLGERYALLAVDLPGTGFSEPTPGRLTLQIAAELVAETVERESVTTIVGHSVGSIVASLAAQRSGSTIETVLSIEGNLTLADAYFSGSAAQYDSPGAFQAALLERLDAMAVGNPTMGRYRDQVARADQRSIWELGCDTDAWSRQQEPGEVLARSAGRVRYLYNPDNTPPESIDWLERNELTTIHLDGASHWMAVDQPEAMAEKLLAAAGTGR